ncbi:MAG: APC family permease [Polyangiales bacterium]
MSEFPLRERAELVAALHRLGVVPSTPRSRGKRCQPLPSTTTRDYFPGMSALDWLLGRPLSDDEAEHQQIGPLAGIPVLGLDALSSAAYGPEAALTLLIPLGAAGLAFVGPISALIVAILGVIFFSYRQTIHAYPGGGGSYTVAKENLGRGAALVAGSALALDYVLNVAVGISAGVGALVSALPKLQPYTLSMCLLILLVLTVVNLRGLRESGIAFMLPTYTFVLTLGVTIAVGVTRAAFSGGHPTPVTMPPALHAPTEAVGVWLLVRAFASGCTAMTGVEAVSNGVPLFRTPAVPKAQRTLTAIIVILASLLGGIAYLCRAYEIGAVDPSAAGYQSILSMLVGAVMGRRAFYYLTMAAVVTVLALSANTSFADFPRLCRVLAEDRFLPDSFAVRGRRLVFTQGILALSLLAAVLLVAFGGITDRLIPLFAIGAFLAFTMSQAGMVVHWRRLGGAEARHSLPLNALGAVATAVTLVVVAVSKFMEGAWITVVVIPLLIVAFLRVNRHYVSVAAQIVDGAPLSLANPGQPIAVVAMQSWNRLTARGLQFAVRLAPEVYAVQVKSETTKMRELTPDWAQLVCEPTRQAGLAPPKLVVLHSRYRQFFKPLIDFVLELRDKNPGRDIVVVIPDLVVEHWYQGFLHNNRGAILRTLLRVRGGPNVVVLNTPFHLHD